MEDRTGRKGSISMGKKLQTRIYLPVLLVLLIFPVFTWTAFSAASNEYFRRMAERNTIHMVEKVRRVIRQERDGKEQEIENKEDKVSEEARVPLREALKKMLESPGNMSVSSEGKTSFLILSTDFKLTYPEASDSLPTVRELYEECVHRIQSGEFPEKTTIPLKVSGGSFMVHLLAASAEDQAEVKYVVCYSSVPSAASLLSSIWKLLIAITALCLVLAAVAIWFITKGITRPLGKLCEKTEAVGNGDYTPITDHFKAEELETLKLSVNQMAENLKNSEESTLAFFQNASHDMKTPLASISGYAQGIQYGILKDPQKAAGIILEESLRMTRLVESILTISKLDNKTLKLQMVPIALEEFLYEQTQILQGSCHGKELKLEDPLPSICVRADAQLLIRIFQNLVSNCLQYAKKEVTVRLSLENKKAVITVADDGAGIQEEALPRIFDRFYKGENGGFGLGLSIVQSGVEYMDGTVSAENRKPPFRGAVFRLVLPACE